MNSEPDYSTSGSAYESDFDWGSVTSDDSEFDSDKEFSQDIQEMNFEPDNTLESDDRDENVAIEPCKSLIPSQLQMIVMNAQSMDKTPHRLTRKLLLLY